MKTTDYHKREMAELKRKAIELERKKNAWKNYEMQLRHARDGYAELELDEF